VKDQKRNHVHVSMWGLCSQYDMCCDFWSHEETLNQIYVMESQYFSSKGTAHHNQRVW